jgi:predicted HTH domain antitoxin
MEITLTIPDQYKVNYDPVELGKRLKLYAALLIFKSGEISAGAAAVLAEIDCFALAAECQKWEIPILNYSVEDLDSDLSALRAKT